MDTGGGSWLVPKPLLLGNGYSVFWCVFVSTLIVTISWKIARFGLSLRNAESLLMYVLRGGYLAFYCERNVLRVGDLEMAGTGGYRRGR